MLDEKKSGGGPVEPKLDAEGNPIPEVKTQDGVDADGNLINPAPDDNDPLDAIEDDKVRDQAKKDRAIARRITKGEKLDNEGNPIVETPPEDKPVVPSNVATKDDLKTMATNAAKKLVAPEVLEAWDEIMKVQLGGFDPMDAESIAENLVQRYNLYRMKNPIDPENPAAPLTTSPKVPNAGGGGKKPVKKDDDNDLPGYKEPAQPDDWYPDEEGK